jgi:hypothetical protein
MSVTLQMTPSMRALLDWFNGQPCACATIGYVTDNTTYSRETIRQNLKQLAADGSAELVHEPTALYRLQNDPREDT